MVRLLREVEWEQFLADWPDWLARLEELDTPILLVRDGRPLAQLTPASSRAEPVAAEAGDLGKRDPALAGSVVWHGDLTAPTDEPWAAEDDAGNAESAA